MARPLLDALDVKILEFLQIDGRMPFTKIAKELSVSEGTVRARVNRLTRSR
jgi:DNA-binding Lrp family transcriptional regulator